MKKLLGTVVETNKMTKLNIMLGLGVCSILLSYLTVEDGLHFLATNTV